MISDNKGQYRGVFDMDSYVRSVTAEMSDDDAAAVDTSATSSTVEAACARTRVNVRGGGDGRNA